MQPQMRLLQKPEPPWSPVTVVWVAHKRRGRTQTVAFFPTCTLAEGRTSPARALRAAATTACLDARSDCEPLPLPPRFLERSQAAITTCLYCSSGSKPLLLPSPALGAHLSCYCLQEPQDWAQIPSSTNPYQKYRLAQSEERGDRHPY